MLNSKNQQNFYSQNEETPNQDSNFHALKNVRSENNESNNFSNKAKNTSQKDDQFFYYETENYKNYKYKLYNIDLAEIERKRLTGRKIHVSDYNYPIEELEERTKKKLFGFNKHFERKGRSEQKLLPSTSVHDVKKLNILNKINKISMDLRIEGTRKTEKPAVENNSQNDILQNLLPKLEKTKNQFKKQDDLQLLNGRLMGIINNKKLNLPLLNTTNKNSNKSVHNNNNENDKSLYRKKIGGGFTLIVKKHALRKLDKNKSVIIDKSILQQNNKNISINEQINQIIKSKKIKKAKSVGELKFKQKPNRTNYEEFIFLARSTQEIIKIGNFIFFFFFEISNFMIIFKNKEEKEKFISLAIMKEYFLVFKNNSDEIGNRILIAFDINPFEENCKIFWEPFSKFKKVLITRESSILERVNFICKVLFIIFN